MRMINVATVFNVSRWALIGPSKNINRLYSNRELFARNGINLIGPFCPEQGFSDAQQYQKSKSFVFKKTVKELLRKTFMGTLLLYRMTNIRLSRKALSSLAGFEGGIDLIVFRDTTSAYQYVKRKGSKPFILVLHCDGTNSMVFSDSGFPCFRGRIGKALMNREFATACVNASGLLFLSEQAIDNFNKLNIQTNAIFGIYHQGVERPHSQPPISVPTGLDPATLVFVSVGSVCRRKNQEGIIRAFKEVSDQDAALVIVGEGDELEKCKRLSEELGISNKVIFTGALNEVGGALAVGDVFVSASFDEGVPNAAVEAMSFGMPLILTDVGACKDLINGNGILLDADDTASLARALKQFCTMEKKEVERLGRASLDLYSSLYSVQHMCEEHATFYLKVYQEAVRAIG